MKHFTDTIFTRVYRRHLSQLDGSMAYAGITFHNATRTDVI